LNVVRFRRRRSDAASPELVTNLSLRYRDPLCRIYFEVLRY